MANDRNAGRKPKYANESKSITFSVPVDVEKEVRTSVREIIDTKAKRFGVEFIEDTVEDSEPKIVKDLWESIEFPCGCVLEKNLLKRAKGSKCKLSKDEDLH